MSDHLIEFLRARLDEDEQVARHACKYAEAEWRLDEEFGETVLWWPPEPHIAVKEREKGLPVVSDEWRGQTIDSHIAPHVARHDPARVLREIDAKRRMIGRIKSHAAVMGWDEVHGDLLRLLALPYADRSGYREEWRP